MIRTTVDVAVSPRRARTGAEIRISVRLGRRAERIWLRITDDRGIVVFRTLPIARRASAAMIIIGTRFFRGARGYRVQASPNRNMRYAGVAAFRLEGRRRLHGLLPLAVTPALVRRRTEEGRPVTPVPVGQESGDLAEAEPGTPGNPPNTLTPPRERDRPDDLKPRIRDPPDREQLEDDPDRDHMEDDPGGTPRRRPNEPLERWRERRDEWRRDRADERRRLKEIRRLHPNLDRPVRLYSFTTERDPAVCVRCRALDGREYWPREWRPSIPVHPNCRCHWTPVFVSRAKVRGRRPGQRLAAALTYIDGIVRPRHAIKAAPGLAAPDAGRARGQGGVARHRGARGRVGAPPARARARDRKDGNVAQRGHAAHGRGHQAVDARRPHARGDGAALPGDVRHDPRLQRAKDAHGRRGDPKGRKRGQR